VAVFVFFAAAAWAGFVAANFWCASQGGFTTGRTRVVSGLFVLGVLFSGWLEHSVGVCDNGFEQVEVVFGCAGLEACSGAFVDALHFAVFVFGFGVFKVEGEGQDQGGHGDVVFAVFLDFEFGECFDGVLLVAESMGESSEPVVCLLAAAVAVQVECFLETIVEDLVVVADQEFGNFCGFFLGFEVVWHGLLEPFAWHDGAWQALDAVEVSVEFGEAVVGFVAGAEEFVEAFGFEVGQWLHDAGHGLTLMVLLRGYNPCCRRVQFSIRF
jgi:hypothetical protein